MSNELRIIESTIPGLYVLNLPVHGDSRGWFKENWQNEKFSALGFPPFRPIQNNISFNDKVGTTRGIHAEPWDKYVSVATGKVFGAWVDLRDGDSFGQVFTIEIDPSVAVYVPRGVGNAYQTLDPNTSYTYLVNAHWSPQAKYTFLNLGDKSSNIQWPILLKDAEVSEKDLNHPQLENVLPFQPKRTLILGSNGQLGKALKEVFPDAISRSRQDFDLTDSNSWSSIDWNDLDIVINAAAYTKVDEAETMAGRDSAWAVNALGVGNLAKHCNEFNILLVHVSSDYVFDGTKAGPYVEDDHISPLGVYGQSKAAGDLLVSQIKSHLIIRTAWIAGPGENFVSKMAENARNSVAVGVVNDQFGVPTFADNLARSIKFLLESKAPSGTYNLTSSGSRVSWFGLAQSIYKKLGADINLVSGISSVDYMQERSKKGFLTAERPQSSTLSIEKISNLGFRSPDWERELDLFLELHGKANN